MKFANRQLLRSFRRRLPRYMPAILAVAVAAGAIGALGSLSSDVSRKMTEEFRRRGANAVARGRAGNALPGTTVRRIVAAPEVERALPVRVQETAAGPRRLVAVGLDFAAAGPFVAGWDVEGRLPASPGEAAAGTRLFERLGAKLGGEIALDLPEGRRSFRLVGRVATGEGEDEELLVPRTALSRADPDEADALLLRLAGSGRRVAEAAARLESRTGARVDPQLAVSTSEGRIVVKLRGLLTALGASIAVLAGLGTATTLMASVVQRRREIALEKALGADSKRLFRRFFAEGAALGAIGGAAGTAGGLIAADRLERSLFGVSLTASPFWIAAPLLLSVALAAAASLPAVRRALRIEAITALREE